MIIALSCCDLLSVLMSTQTFFLRLTFWMTETDLLTAIQIYHHLDDLFAAISMFALLVMSIERYLGVYYPIYHHTSVTRRRLLTLLAIFSIFPATLLSISANQMISYPMALGIFFLVYVAPFIFFNYRLFKISTKIRLRNAMPPEKRIRITNFKSVSSCLLAVACLVFFSIASFLFIIISSVEGSRSNTARLSYTWTALAFRMNCTFNSLIFFWKNKVLRIEGMKILQSFKSRVSGTETNSIA